jgi:2-deoxy-D-gluconate 3-dehydrogenase
MILDDFRLDGQIALITGAARGLGQGMALGLAEAGADIAGVDILTMEETAAKVQGTGREFVGISADLTADGEPARVVQHAISKLGRPTILVNNAGIIRRTPAEDFTAADWDQVMNVNLRAVFFLTQVVGREMIKAGTGGKVINICSMLSYSGGILVASYTASKSAVAGLTRLLGNEWAKYGINVNGIAPGYMATANTEPIQKDKQRSQEILARVPLGRWGTPQDLQGAVVFLASKASAYITGTILRVDGGWLTR